MGSIIGFVGDTKSTTRSTEPLSALTTSSQHPCTMSCHVIIGREVGEEVREGVEVPFQGAHLGSAGGSRV